MVEVSCIRVGDEVSHELPLHTFFYRQAYVPDDERFCELPELERSPAPDAATDNPAPPHAAAEAAPPTATEPDAAAKGKGKNPTQGERLTLVENECTRLKSQNATLVAMLESVHARLQVLETKK